MNKKLKKMLATVSAVAVCAVSMTAMTSGAIDINNPGINKYTTSFKIDNTKYVVWQEMTDYYDRPEYKFFISEDGSDNFGLYGSSIFTSWGWGDYFLYNEEATILEEYFTANGIEYETSPCIIDDVAISPIVNTDEFQFAKKVKEDTGFIRSIRYHEDEVYLNVTDVVNTLPEVTLSGDADCNNKVSIDDVVLIMQSIANPDKYQMTIQGIVNADVFGDGDGVTISDAVEIQSMVASHAFD
ncbi:MAG: hypothetical protein K2J08_12345 [Ruminococcus sp.]|nr:hypothetical protein [Ruminococcus sp.]